MGSSRGRRCVPFAGWLLLSFLCACEADSKHDADRQIVARVNGDGITVRDLSDQFDRIESRSGMDPKIGKKRVLDLLVDEKLLAQKALEAGLDRRPETIGALDRARRQVLAQATIDQASASGQVGFRETKAFYDDHPELFERRKTYIFHRFELLTGELPAPLKAELGRAETPAEVSFMLKRANVRFSEQTEVRTAELVQPDVLKQAAEMLRGDILMTREGGRIVFMQLIRSIAEPVDFSRATPAIRAYLAEASRKRAARVLLKGLRDGARIEYSEWLQDAFNVRADAEPFDPMKGHHSEVARVGIVSSPK